MARIVIVGYGQMLCSLIDGTENSGHEICGVFRNDRIKYTPFELFFKDIFNPSADYAIIKSEKLHDIKAQSVNDDKFLKEIKKLKPDLIVVGSWAEKFKKRILDTIPCVNFHPALLPKNRGANPYFWSIYLNQKVTGLTVHFMDERFDGGDIILQEPIIIDENETGKTLKDKTVKLAKVMIKDFLDLWQKGQIQPIVQNEKYATYEKQISNKEVIIDLNQSKEDVSRHLRALYPWAEPYVKVFRHYVKISKYEFLETDEKTEDKKINEIVENNKKYFILKGKNFLIKIHK